MKTRSFILAIVLIFTVPAVMSGQVGNMLKNKAAKVLGAGVKAASNQADTATKNGAYNATEKALDKREQNKAQNAEQNNEADESAQNAGSTQNQSRPSGGQGGGVNIGGLFGGKVTSKYNETYSFNNRMYMQMEIYDKKDVTKMDYYIYFNDDQPSAGIEAKIVGESDEGEQVNIMTSSIFDGVNKSFIILTDMGTMKMGIISDVPDESTVQSADPNAPKPTITKTGNSKTIIGYKCDEYIYRDNKSKDYIKLWVTKDLKLTGDRRAYSKAGVPMYAGDPDLENGTTLATESYNEKNEIQAKSETKEINKGFKHSISTTGFTLRQMNFAQAGGQQKK